MFINVKNKFIEKFKLNQVGSELYHSKTIIRRIYDSLKKLCMIGVACYFASSVSVFAIDNKNIEDTSVEQNVTEVELETQSIRDLYEDARSMLDKGDHSEGLKRIKELADNGYAIAQNFYGLVLRDGLYDTLVNGEQGAIYFNKVIANSEAHEDEVYDARQRLADLYFYGEAGVQQDANKALDLWTDIAQDFDFAIDLLYYLVEYSSEESSSSFEQLSKKAQKDFKVALDYYYGYNVPQNIEQALKIMELIAETEDCCYAWRNIGLLTLMHRNNFQLSIKYYLKAAHLGCFGAMQFVSILYRLEGNEIESQFWLKKAISYISENANNDKVKQENLCEQ